MGLLGCAENDERAYFARVAVFCKLFFLLRCETESKLMSLCAINKLLISYKKL